MNDYHIKTFNDGYVESEWFQSGSTALEALETAAKTGLYFQSGVIYEVTVTDIENGFSVIFNVGQATR